MIVVSAFSPQHGARAVDALAEGAFDLVAKPAVGESLDDFAKELVSKVEAATTRRRPAAGLARASRLTAVSGVITPPTPRIATPATDAASR